MSFLNPALLLGLGLVLIPVLLHLMLRAKPKRLIFPALRLIQQRRRQNIRRMNLRHLWLLLLRMGVIALIVVAVCRPSLPAANYSFTVTEWVSLLAIVAVSVGAYFGVMQWWQRQSLNKSALLTRRTMLRGGIGTVALLLALLGVVWPYSHRVLSEIKDPTPLAAENVPVAAVFLFDTSASMSYKQANKTRLRESQDLAKSHLGRFPAGSKVAIAATSETVPVAFSADLVAAQSRIESLDVKMTGQPLNDRLTAMLQVQEDDRRRVTSEQSSVPEEQRQDKFRREIYLFTDLSKSAWRDESTSLLLDELQRLRWRVYIIDTGEENPSNVSLTELSLSRDSAPVGSAVRVEATVAATGVFKPEQSVELFLKLGDGQPVKKGAESVKLESGSEARVTFFPVEVPAQPYVHGELRLVGSDPLNTDDVAYFTIKSIPSLKLLVVAESPAIARYWMQALKDLAAEGVSAFQTEFVTTDQLARKDLKSFDAVCLINASNPSDAAWTSLRGFIDAGGGLAVFLGASSSILTESSRGEQINPLGYNSVAAAAVLPAKLEASSRHSPARVMDLRRSQHQLLKRFDESALTELGLVDVRRYWKVAPYQDGVVIARYAGATDDDDSGPPALLERRIGQGRVVMMTTGVDGIAWNDLIDGWQFVAFADQLTQYLAWQASGSFNHIVGDEAALPLDRDRKLTKVIVRMPDFKQRAVDVPAKATVLSMRDLTSVGSYSVDSADRSVDYHTGFSMNLSAAESRLERMKDEELEKILGKDHFSVARDMNKLERDRTKDRLGQEMYGMIVAFLIAVFALEQFTATWFYRTDES